jgi:hypothetical protein
MIEALLQKNFYSDRDLSVEGEWGHWSNRKKFEKPVPFGLLFGSHHYVDAENSIYIYRDGRAVAYSLWKSEGFLNPYLRSLMFTDFIRCKLDWKNSPGYEVKPPRQTVFEQWHEHVNWYLTRTKNVFCVRYEELVLFPDRIIEQIAVKFALPFEKFKPLEEKVGPSPNDGTINAWKGVWFPEDNKYFHSIVPKDFKGLWND